MGVRHMQGTPWHLEQVHREENDPRRYKGRCRYYNPKTGCCSRRHGKCIGSAHCMEYNALSDGEFRRRQEKTRQFKQRKKAQNKKVIGVDDCYYYL